MAVHVFWVLISIVGAIVAVMGVWMGYMQAGHYRRDLSLQYGHWHVLNREQERRALWIWIKGTIGGGVVIALMAAVTLWPILLTEYNRMVTGG